MEESLHRLSKLFQALGNGVRLQLLRKLQEGELSVKKLSEHVDRTSQTISHHLKILRDNDLLFARTVGKNRLYRIKRPKLVAACLGLIKFLRRDE